MAHALSELVGRVGRFAARDGLTDLTDGELLDRFAADRDAVAFEVLVRRHGGMVAGVCARVLGRGGEAEDAFQATFLALVRHAGGVRAGGSLAGWLYRVARRISVRAARGRARSACRERVAARPEAFCDDAAERSDWRAALDRELDRLPACYRDAFVLCHLEGRAHEDAARELGCALGTLHSRLARAKDRLRRRLAACGVALTGIGSPAASARLVTATVELVTRPTTAAPAALVALSQGVWKPMVLLNTKFVTAALLTLAAVGSGVGVLRQPAATAVPAARLPQDPAVEELKRENERLRRELAELKKRLDAAETRLRQADADVPTDAEVLRSLPKAPDGAVRDDVTIVKNKILDRLDPPRLFPNVGRARLHAKHWECKVHYTETTKTPEGTPASMKRVYTVYIDKELLILTPGEEK